ncbi:MAG: vWA domain-containing protein, partial [Chitinophagaceae bacterium]
MKGIWFTQYKPENNQQSPFEKLLSTFLQLLPYTSGDVSEALSWLTELDQEYPITREDYGMGDFIQDLKDKGFIQENNQEGQFLLSPKTEQQIRRNSLEEIFGKLKKSSLGNHDTFKSGLGDELNSDTRPYQFGDSLEQIDFTTSIRNAQINHGLGSFSMNQDDLEVRETDFKAQTSTALMIDISHSMILYGEDRITPAKKVAMALSELIITKYPKDTL